MTTDAYTAATQALVDSAKETLHERKPEIARLPDARLLAILQRRSRNDYLRVSVSSAVTVDALLQLAFADIETARAHAIFKALIAGTNRERTMDEARRAIEAAVQDWLKCLSPLPENPTELWYAAHARGRKLHLSEPVATVEEVMDILNSDRQLYRDNLAVVERGGVRWLARGARAASGRYQFRTDGTVVEDAEEH
jgi:hypothetical protein